MEHLKGSTFTPENREQQKISLKVVITTDADGAQQHDDIQPSSDIETGSSGPGEGGEERKRIIKETQEELIQTLSHEE